MESLFGKGFLIFFKLLISVPLLVWSLFSKNHESEVYEFMKESGLDSVFDFFSGGFMCFVSFYKIEGMDITLHSVFEAIFFYLGGTGATTWALFRLKLAYLDHKLKKAQLDGLEKDNALKDTMIKDFEKGMNEVNDLKKHLKEK